jgi:hypothetical protein
MKHKMPNILFTLPAFALAAVYRSDSQQEFSQLGMSSLELS